MKMFKFDVKGWAVLGAWTGAVVTGIGIALAKFGGLSINFATIDVAAQRGALASLGNTILAKSPFAASIGSSWMMMFVTMIIATVAVMLAGRVLLDLVPNQFRNTAGKKVTSVLFIGTMLLNFLLLRPAGLPVWTGVIALGLMSFLLSWVMVTLASKVSAIRIPQN